MPSNFTGINVGGMPIFPGGGSSIPATTGTVFYVSSVTGNDSNYGTDSGQALATINKAFTLCTASKGDVIIVLAGHAESISGVGAIAANKIGVSVIGLGNGTLRPKITLHTTATTIAVSAANILFRNLQIATDVDAVVTVFNITAGGCTLDAVDFVETAACACLQFVLTTASATDLTIQNSRWIQTQTAATALQQWIVLTGADRFRCFNNLCNLKGYATSNPANGVIVGATTLSDSVFIAGNTLITTNSTGAITLSLFSGTTGFVNDNACASAKTAIAGNVAIASCYGKNNYSSHVVNKNGLLDPVVDA